MLAQRAIWLGLLLMRAICRVRSRATAAAGAVHVRVRFALRLRQWLADVGAQTLYIEPGSPWENGYCESFNSKLRDEFLNGEIFYSLKEAQILTERWRVHYNTVRPHSSLGYRPPAPMAYRLAMPPPSESRSVPSAVM